VGHPFQNLVAYRLAVEIADEVFLRVARGSLNETEHWLKRAEIRGLIDPGLGPKLAEAGRALNGLIRRPAPTPPNR
jgi:hypothetical protein